MWLYRVKCWFICDQFFFKYETLNLDGWHSWKVACKKNKDIMNMNMSLLLIPRTHEHNAAQLLFFWWVSYSEHLNCRIIFSVVIENKQCLHLCKQSTCKVANEYDSWFNLSLISERGCVKCAWLNHECWVKSGCNVWWAVSCVNGAYLMLRCTHGVCRFSFGQAWLLADAANQDTSNHTPPLWRGVCSQITNSQQRGNDVK